MKGYVSPALPQFSTSSPLLAAVATQFFAPWLTLREAEKMTKTKMKTTTKGGKKWTKRRGRRTSKSSVTT